MRPALLFGTAIQIEITTGSVVVLVVAAAAAAFVLWRIVRK